MARPRSRPVRTDHSGRNESGFDGAAGARDVARRRCKHITAGANGRVYQPWCLLFTPQEPQLISVPAEVVKTLPEKMQRLLGYTVSVSGLMVAIRSMC